MAGRAHEEALINQPSQRPTYKRPNPIDPVVGPFAGGEGRAEGAGRVHGGAGVGPAGEDVGADDEADEERAERADGAAPVDDGGVDGEEEGEGEHGLHGHGARRADAGRRRVHRDGLLAAGEGGEEEAGEGGAEQLGGGVERGAEEGDVAAGGEAERDGRVDVAAGDVQPRGDHDGDHQRVRRRHRRQPHYRVAAAA
ncbi:Os01g0231950, partial [Oryza sativa Japonica Group]